MLAHTIDSWPQTTHTKTKFFIQHFWDWVGMSLMLALVIFLQWRLSFLGLHYDDYLVFRHYALSDVARSFWSDIGVVTSPELWISAYRPLTLVAHAATYEAFGFLPENLLIARILVHSATGILFAIWLRVLGYGAGPAWFGAMSFVLFPINFHIFRWSTEIGAISGLMWFLLSLIFQTKSLNSKSLFFLSASYVCWALALLTKEVVVPAILVITLLELLSAKQRSLRNLFRSVFPYWVILGLYMLIRSFVLQGKWGGQGVSPDTIALPQFMFLAAQNYWLFLQNILLLDTVAVLHPKSALPALLVSVPVAVMFLALSVRLHTGYLKVLRQPLFSARLATVFAHQNRELTVPILGFSLLLSGGLICCFYPVDRIMYVSTLGCAVLAASLVQLLLTQFRMNRSMAGVTFVSVLCVIHLASCQLLFYQRALAPSSPFVKSAEMYDLQAYFTLGHLFQRWEAAEQAQFLRAKLVSGSWIDSRGVPNSTAIRERLIWRGYSPQDADEFVGSLIGRSGACELLKPLATEPK
jgi:hypothetical protein